jgi:hypothetical protein
MRTLGLIVLFLALSLQCASADERAATRAHHYHWYGLSNAQHGSLVEALRAVPPPDRKPVWVLCDQLSDCRDLAQDVHSALEEAGWIAMLERPGGMAEGMRITCSALMKAVLVGTGIRSHLDEPDDEEHCAINIGRKGK